MTKTVRHVRYFDPIRRSHFLSLVFAKALRLSTLGIAFSIVMLASAQEISRIHLVRQPPETILRVASGSFLVDFGQVAFGNLLIIPPQAGSAFHLTVSFGEKLKDAEIDTQPPGAVRFAAVNVSVTPGRQVVVAPPADERNTHGQAVLTPPEFGVLLPFRWVEVTGWPGDLNPGSIFRQAAFDSTWSEDAGTFQSSDPVLNSIWDLSHYSIKATTFAGIFVDGDRERVAYEADAYLTQLGYYYGNANPRMVRATFDHLMGHPTWPTEWAPHMVFMAYADWMETGDSAWLRAHYEDLKGKLLNHRVGPDGLVTSSTEQMGHDDIVDWPQKERDGYVFTHVNTVVNAFRLKALSEMAELATAVGKPGEAREFRRQEKKGAIAFRRILFDPARGLYRDGVGTDHTSLHANLFPLAFGLVPKPDRKRIAGWLATRGMVCSVYAAQYLLEALFENGQSQAALRLISAPGDRSWRHMVDSGATITWEAWDQKYKPNQDWNHAWGAAPANLLPRFVLGAQPLSPGWEMTAIQPHPGNLRFAEGAIPTPKGQVHVRWRRDGRFSLELNLPTGMAARVMLPVLGGTRGVSVNGRPVRARREAMWWKLADPVAGRIVMEEF